jgi:hypothetical protein
MIRELAESAAEIYHAAAIQSWYHTYLVYHLSKFLRHQSESLVVRGQLYPEEWTARCEILWWHQQKLRYDVIEASEASSRREATFTLFDAGKQRTELLHTERSERAALQTERLFFLLRVVRLVEAEDRSNIESNARRDSRSLLQLQEEHHRRSLVSQLLQKHMDRTVAFEASRRILNSLAEERRRGLLNVEYHESAERVALQNRKETLVNKFTWLCVVQEERQRRLLIEAPEHLQMALLATMEQESIERIRLVRKAQTSMLFNLPSGPLSGQDVRLEAHPYLYTTELMESSERQIRYVRPGLKEFWDLLAKEKAALFHNVVRASAFEAASGR